MGVRDRVWNGHVHTAVHTHLTWVTNKERLCSTGDSAVFCCSLNGSLWENGYTYVWLRPFTFYLKPTLFISYIPIQNSLIKIKEREISLLKVAS